MARSKRIILSICAVLITCVMCTVSAFAYGSSGEVNQSQYWDYARTVIPFDMMIFGATQSGGQPLYISAPKFTAYPYGYQILNGKNEMELISTGSQLPSVDIKTSSFTYNVDRRMYSHSWETVKFIPEDGWGMERNGMTELPLTFKAKDFYFSTYCWGLDYPYLPSITLYDVPSQWQGEIVYRAQVQALVVNSANNTSFNAYIEILEVAQLDQGETTLFLTQDMFYDAVDASDYPYSIKNQIKQQSILYIQYYSVECAVPLSQDRVFDASIYETLTDGLPTSGGLLSGSPFANYNDRYVIPLIDYQPHEVDFNIGATIVDNVNELFDIEIFKDFTIGNILMVCVGIGALFGILKYFAGG